MTRTPGERVSPLRQRMLEEMRLANLAENTQVCYLREITCLARDCKAPVVSRIVSNSGGRFVPVYSGHGL